MAFVLPALAALTIPDQLGTAREPAVLTWPTTTAIPNFSDWQAGDLVLVRSDGSAMARVIEGVRGSLLSSAPPTGDPAWTHVALYVDQGLVIESAPRRGIRYCPVHEYALDRELRVRRLLRGGTPVMPAEGRRRQHRPRSQPLLRARLFVLGHCASPLHADGAAER